MYYYRNVTDIVVIVIFKTLHFWKLYILKHGVRLRRYAPMAMDFCANFEGVSSHGQTGWNSFIRPPNHPPILNIMCHDGYAPLGAIVFSPWQAKVNANVDMIKAYTVLIKKRREI